MSRKLVTVTVMMQCFSCVLSLLQMSWQKDCSRSEYIWPADLGEGNGGGGLLKCIGFS